MLVSITGFGSIWRSHFGKDPNDPRRFAHGAYYNTTGVAVAGTIRQRPRITGYARFHACGGFDPNHLSRMIGRVFECAEPCIWLGANKLLFERALRRPEKPDSFLIVVRPEQTGRLTVGQAAWRSAETWLISFSECGAEQEAMLLIPAYAWLQTELGRFVLEPDASRPWLARLVLASVRQ